MAGEDRTIDAILDAGAAPLQYFRAMLKIAEVISRRTWPQWQADLCSRYDDERSTDLAALRGDAAMLRAQATALRHAQGEQQDATGRVRAAWPDAAGQAASTTLTEHQERSEPVVAALEATAGAADGVADTVVAAVSEKVRRLAEFSQSNLPVTGLNSLMLDVTAFGQAAAGVLDPGLVLMFEAQLEADLLQFYAIVNATRDAIRAAYAAIPDAAAVGPQDFPTPAFATITETGTPTTPTAPAPSAPAATSAGTSTGASPGGSARTSTGTSATPAGTSPGSSAPTSAAPASSSPVSAGPATTTTGASVPAATESPATGSGAVPASTLPAGTTSPGGGSTGTQGADGAMPSWLSQLLPKLTEQLGLGDDPSGKDRDKDDVEDGGDETAASGKDGDEAEDDAAEPVPGTAGAVTATLGPDGKTVEVTVRKPDGTEQRATLRIGEDGRLTLDGEPTTESSATGSSATEPASTDASSTEPPTAEQDCEQQPDAAQPGATPTASQPDTGPGAPVTAADPSASEQPVPEQSEPEQSAQAPASPAPAAAVPTAPAPTPEKSAAAPSGGENEACPPGGPPGSTVDENSGAEFAITVP